MTRLLGAMAVIVGAAVLNTPPATAAEPDAQGWWFIAGDTGAPTALTAPDVPDDGMLIDGGAGASPDAYAALRWDGDPTGPLTLTVAPGSGTTPGATLELCPLTEPTFEAVQGGPMADAPAFDCARSVSAGPSESGDRYEFDVGQVAGANGVAVAVLPTTATDRVVLDKPDQEALAVADAEPAPSSGDEEQAAGGSFGAPAVGYEPALSGADFVAPSPEVVAVTAPEPAAVAAEDRPATEVAAAATDPLLPLGDEDGGASPLAVVAVLALVTIGAVSWAVASSSAGRRDEADASIR